MIRGRGAVSTIAGMLLLLTVALTASHASDAPGPFPRPDLVFHMPDGFDLPAREWDPPAGTRSTGIILALHGFTDSRDAWELPAPVFAAAGYTVIAPDQRGFGATASRGIWPGPAALKGDAAALLDQLRARHPGQRVILMGESMGAAVAICVAAAAPPAADAYVLVSPAVWARSEMALTLRVSLWAANAVAPGWLLTGREVPLDIAPSDNRAALIRLANDPLTLHGATVSMLHGLTDLMDEAMARTPSLPPQTLILSGRRDRVVPQAATAAFWSRLPAGVRRGQYLAGFHLLLRDTDRALVGSDILSWLAAPARWLPSGADINAAAWQSDHAWETAIPPLLPAKLPDALGPRPVWPY